ncbi:MULTISPECIES: YdhR family protein [Kitasatospora]
MKAMIAWWDLTESQQSAETLRDFLREEAEQAWSDIPGLILKIWVSDPASNRWGAVFLWESEEAAAAAKMPRSAGELIGYPLAFREWFDVEATVEGLHSLTSLSGLGLALQSLVP